MDEPVVSQRELDNLIASRIAAEPPRTRKRAERMLDALMETGPGWWRASRPVEPVAPAGPFPVALLPDWPKEPCRRGSADLAALLRRNIRIGAIPPWSVLPTSGELAARYHVGVRTVARATEILRDEGLAVRRGTPGKKGSRLYVTTPSRTQAA